jgi:hypothetical protein
LLAAEAVAADLVLQLGVGVEAVVLVDFLLAQVIQYQQVHIQLQ